MLRVVVLGAAAGGGVPQWNCGCPVCLMARSENPDLQSTQALAVSESGDGGGRRGVPLTRDQRHLEV